MFMSHVPLVGPKQSHLIKVYKNNLPALLLQKEIVQHFRK